MTLAVGEDSGAFHETAEQALFAGWNKMLVKWEASAAADPSLQINSETPMNLTALGTEDARIEFVRWRVAGGVLGGISGFIGQDDFSSWR